MTRTSIVLAALMAASAGTAVPSAASASPTLVPLVDRGAQPEIVEVRGGCGFGEHRGPFGGCRINHGPRGRLRAFATGLPGGCPPGMHRGFYGRCRY